jgi:hypothetical protein
MRPLAGVSGVSLGIAKAIPAPTVAIIDERGTLGVTVNTAVIGVGPTVVVADETRDPLVAATTSGEDKIFVIEALVTNAKSRAKVRRSVEDNKMLA